MTLTVISKSYSDFIKEDVLPFCEMACEKYQIPVLLLSTMSDASAIVSEFIKLGVCVDPAPTTTGIVGAVKHDLDSKKIQSRLRKLNGECFFITDQKSFTESDFDSINTRGAGIIFIDDLDAVPPLEFLGKWSVERNVKLIVRADGQTWHIHPVR